MATMPVALIIVVGAVQFTVGVIIGTFIVGRRRQTLNPAGGDFKEQISELLSRMQLLSRTISSDLGAYKEDIGQVGKELSAARDPRDNSESIDEETLLRLLSDIASANVRLQERLQSTEEQLSIQAALIETQTSEAYSDPLTGLANRRAFDHELLRRFSEWERKGNPFSLVFIDVDKFKLLNDTYGHLAGDEELRKLADVFLDTVRPMDVVTRYGGEEFAVLLPSTTTEDAAVVAERLRHAVEHSLVTHDDAKIHITASLGISEVLQGDTLNSVVQRVDIALYASKDAGRNCTHIHDGTKVVPLSANTLTKEGETQGKPLEEKQKVACSDLRKAVAKGKIALK